MVTMNDTIRLSTKEPLAFQMINEGVNAFGDHNSLLRRVILKFNDHKSTLKTKVFLFGVS